MEQNILMMEGVIAKSLQNSGTLHVLYIEFKAQSLDIT